MNRNTALARTALAGAGLLALSLCVRSASQETQTAVHSPPIRPTQSSAGPLQPPPSVPRGATKAVVVRSWNKGSTTGWFELSAEWPNYGSTPIVISTALGGVSVFTYDDLVAAGADVVILSNPAGGLQRYTQAEIDALQKYCGEGHNLIGTYKVFRWPDIDNTALAPLFGLRDDVTYHGSEFGISNTFRALTEHRIFRGLSMHLWQSSGYPATEGAEESPQWGAIDQPDAQIIAECDNTNAVVTIHRAPEHYAIFFSNMPEYFGSAVDKQLLYNAIVHPLPPSSRRAARETPAGERRAERVVSHR